MFFLGKSYRCFSRSPVPPLLPPRRCRRPAEKTRGNSESPPGVFQNHLVVGAVLFGNLCCPIWKPMPSYSVSYLETHPVLFGVPNAVPNGCPIWKPMLADSVSDLPDRENTALEIGLQIGRRRKVIRSGHSE